MDGSRTHRGSQNDPPPVLKTGEPTGTQPPPEARRDYTSEQNNRLCAILVFEHLAGIINVHFDGDKKVLTLAEISSIL